MLIRDFNKEFLDSLTVCSYTQEGFSFMLIKVELLPTTERNFTQSKPSHDSEERESPWHESIKITSKLPILLG